jgi:hypothetical protein
MARVPPVARHSRKQLLEQQLEPPTLGSREKVEQVAEHRKADYECPHRRRLTGLRQDKRACAGVWSRSPLNESRSFEAVDEAHSSGVGDRQYAGQKGDVLSRPEA